jgi:hypothetical protein
MNINDTKALNTDITLHDSTQTSLNFHVINLSLLKQDKQLIDCRLSFAVNSEFYQRIDTDALFNLKPEIRELFAAEKFHSEYDIKIEVNLKHNLLDHLAKHANNSEEATNYLFTLSRENPDDPLLFTENWLALSVKQQLESGEIGYNTLWNYINPSSLTAGGINSENVGNAVTKFFADWIEVNLATNLQKSTSEILDGITNFFKEFADERPDVVPQQNKSNSTHIKNIDEPKPIIPFPLIEPRNNLFPPPLIIDGEIGQVSNNKIFVELINFFKQNEWSFSQIENQPILQVSFQGANGKWNCYARAREKQQQVVFYSIFPVNAPENKRLVVAEFITRANSGTIIGNFELDFTDGEIRYKTSIDIEGDRLSFALIKNLVYANVSMMDEYLPGIMSVIYGDVEPQQAIAQIEK